MMYYQSEDILTGADKFFEFNEKLITEVINHLNEGKFNLTFFTDKHEKYVMTEKWFGTEYDEIGEN